MQDPADRVHRQPQIRARAPQVPRVASTGVMLTRPQNGSTSCYRMLMRRPALWWVLAGVSSVAGLLIGDGANNNAGDAQVAENFGMLAAAFVIGAAVLLRGEAPPR